VRIVRVTAWHGLERRFRLGYPIFAPSLVWRLWRELDWCETVHIHGFMFLSSIVAALLARGRGKTIILTDHGGIQHFQSRVKRLLVRIGAATVGRITARCSTRLVAYNSRIARLLERLAARPGQCELLLNPVDRGLFQAPSAAERTQLRAALGWQPDRHKVLFVGRLTEEKGVPDLLQCASPSYDLVFCGPGNPNILGALPRPGIEYLPPRPQTELVKLYQSADLLSYLHSRARAFRSSFKRHSTALCPSYWATTRALSPIARSADSYSASREWPISKRASKPL